MRRPQGYAIRSEPGKPDDERDTITCAHCQRLVFVRAKEDPSSLGGFCRLCMRHLCAPCADEGSCTPFEKKLEQMEASARLRRAVG